MKNRFRGIFAAVLSMALLLAGVTASSARLRPDPDAKYRAALKGIHRPSNQVLDAMAAKNPKYKKYVAWIQADENWIDVLKQIETQTGLFFADLNIKVEVFEGTHGARKGEGNGKMGRGWLKIWLGSMQDLHTLWKTSVHEVAHIYTGAAALGPMWLVEGSSNYAGEIHTGVPLMGGTVNPISDSTPLPAGYGRGWLFFVYVEQKYGKEATKKFFQNRVVQGMKYREAFEKATGTSWDKLAAEEYAWTKDNFQTVYNDYQRWSSLKVSFGFDSNESEEGLTVAKFRDDSPLEKAGIKVGDLITHFDGKRVWGMYDFIRKGYALKSGDKIVLTVKRDGKEQKFPVTVSARK